MVLGSLFLTVTLKMNKDRIAEIKLLAQRIRIGEHAFAESVNGKPTNEVLHDALMEVLAALPPPPPTNDG